MTSGLPRLCVSRFARKSIVLTYEPDEKQAVRNRLASMPKCSSHTKEARNTVYWTALAKTVAPLDAISLRNSPAALPCCWLCGYVRMREIASVFLCLGSYLARSCEWPSSSWVYFFIDDRVYCWLGGVFFILNRSCVEIKCWLCRGLLFSCSLSHRYSSDIGTMSGGLDVLALQEGDVTKMLAAGVHLGAGNADFQMLQYVYKRKNDGKFIDRVLVYARGLVGEPCFCLPLRNTHHQLEEDVGEASCCRSYHCRHWEPIWCLCYFWKDTRAGKWCAAVVLARVSTSSISTPQAEIRKKK